MNGVAMNRAINRVINTVINVVIDIATNRAIIYAGTFNIPTSYQYCVWEREANINGSMVICQGSTHSELP